MVSIVINIRELAKLKSKYPVRSTTQPIQDVSWWMKQGRENDIIYLGSSNLIFCNE
jgi:hypothetical protein